MKIVIQCAGQKAQAAGSLQTADGRRVHFVAHPPPAELGDGRLFARPDDRSDDGRTWRERLLSYNAAPGANPLALLPAYRLYRRDVYRSLEQRFGAAKLFILSAGWGLIPATFLTPDYNVTFSASAGTVFRRRRADVFQDWAMIECSDSEPLLFLGGKDYMPHFARLTDHCAGPRIVLFNSATEPRREGLLFVRYMTSTRTNWHYEAASALVAGTLALPGISSGQ